MPFLRKRPEPQTAQKKAKITEKRNRIRKKATLKEINQPINKSHNKLKIFNPDSIKTIFNDSQHFHRQEKCLQDLLSIYNSIDSNQFNEHFILNLKILLNCFPKSPFTKHSLTFIAKFIITIENNSKKVIAPEDESTFDEIGVSFFGSESFLEPTVVGITLLDTVLKELLFPSLKSPYTSVRHNTCLLLGKIFQEVTDIRKDTYNQIQGCLLDRMVDRNHYVRSLAATALRRFQELDDPQHPVTVAYLFHLQKDPNFQVRLSVLYCIEFSRHTLCHIIQKTRDIKALIRKAAFIRIADGVSIKVLSIEQRLSLLKDGINDRNESVRKVFETRVLNSWIKGYDEDLIELLLALDIQSDPGNVEKMLKVIFKQYLDAKEELCGTKLHQLVENFRERFLDTSKLLIKQHQTPEKAFMWRCLNFFLKENEAIYLRKARHQNATQLNNPFENDSLISQMNSNDEIVDFLVPEFPLFCAFVHDFCHNIDIGNPSDEELLDLDFIYCQFSKQLLIYDEIDNSQDSSINKLIKVTLFSSLYLKFTDCISPMMEFLATRVYKDTEKLLEFTAESTTKVYNDAAEAMHEETRSGPVNFDPQLMKQCELEYAKITVEIEENRDSLDKALKEQDYIIAQQLKDKLTILNERRKEIVRNKMNFSGSSQQNTQFQMIHVFDFNECPGPLLQCLLIFTGCLEYGNIETINAIILSNVEKITLPGVLSSEPKLRNIAIKSLGLSCLLSSKLFKKHFNLFVQVLKYDEEDVRITALHCLFDCLCKFGISLLVEERENLNKSEVEARINRIDLSSDQINNIEDDNMETKIDETNNTSINESLTIPCRGDATRFLDTLDLSSEKDVVDSVVELFLDQILNSECDNIKVISLEGLGKLLIFGVVYSPSILSNLICIWYLPSTIQEITHFLGIFLPIYFCSDTNYLQKEKVEADGQICLRDCILETINFVYEAKLKTKEKRDSTILIQKMPSLKNYSELASVDLKNMISFMLELLSKAHHGEILKGLCLRMLEIISMKEEEYFIYEELLMDILLKACSQLQFDGVKQSLFNEIKVLINKILVNIKAKLEYFPSVGMKRVQRFVKSIQELLRSFHRANSRYSLLLEETFPEMEGIDEMEKNKMSEGIEFTSNINEESHTLIEQNQESDESDQDDSDSNIVQRTFLKRKLNSDSSDASDSSSNVTITDKKT